MLAITFFLHEQKSICGLLRDIYSYIYINKRQVCRKPWQLQICFHDQLSCRSMIDTFNLVTAYPVFIGTQPYTALHSHIHYRAATSLKYMQLYSHALACTCECQLQSLACSCKIYIALYTMYTHVRVIACTCSCSLHACKCEFL